MLNAFVPAADAAFVSIRSSSNWIAALLRLPSAAVTEEN